MKILVLCNYVDIWVAIIILVGAKELQLPGSCQPGQYYESSTLACRSCPANASMNTSADGFGCSCAEHSVPVGIDRCRPCNATSVVSADGATCVARRCQNVSGRIACRKCPADYITVTLNIDGSPLKEVQCVKCARGFKAANNVCVRCESCTCTKNQIIVRGICIPKSYVNSRPKYEEGILHPLALLDVVKHEYLCMQNDLRACHTLTNECVKNFYSTDPAGPCRLWIQSNLNPPKALPRLTVESTLEDKNPGEITLTRKKQDYLLIVSAVFSSNGGLKLMTDIIPQASPCRLPIKIRIGRDFSYYDCGEHKATMQHILCDCDVLATKRMNVLGNGYPKPEDFRFLPHGGVAAFMNHVFTEHDCTMNTSTLLDDFNESVSPHLYAEGNLVQIPVYPTKPNGYSVQRGTWLSNKFTRYFIMDHSLSTIANITNTVFLRKLVIRLRIVRDKGSPSSLGVHISSEASYAVKSTFSDSVVMTLSVVHVMPEAGVHRGLEIWGGVLGCLLTLYAMVQWRGVVRRGGLYVSIVPLLAGAIADTLYFAAWFSTLYALAAEAGTLGLTLPLSRAEERIIRAFIYSAVSLKAVKVAWINFNQCRCDIFFLDWSEYNAPFKGATNDHFNNCRATAVAREWSAMQTLRKVSPGYTVTLALLILHVMSPWQSYLPPSQGYRWSVATIAWWSSYTTLLVSRWVADRLRGSPTSILPKICRNSGLSLLVFEEDYYAHYVHGRNNDSKDLRSISGPVATCRVVCAPQLRLVYKQLSLSVPGLGETETRQALLSRFLAAFFERALDGLSWVASERTILERLLNVELTTREAGNTSTLLYDPDEDTPSCFAVTWWGEEWSLSTFDAMLFSCLLIATDDSLLAALVTLIIWQIVMQVRKWFGDKNQKLKTEIEI